MKKIKYIDLFAGCGGLSLGFDLSGDFESVGFVEYWKPAIDTFKKNFPKSILLGEDITKVTEEDLKKLNGNSIDLIVGGPPCQGFSIAGKRDPKDPRNSLFMDFVRIVKIVKPRMFLMENVKGLISMKTASGEKVLEVILREFEKLGYKVKYKVIDSANYGIPQHRHRIFFVGMKGEKNNFEFPKETHAEKEKILVDGTKINKFRTVRDVISDLEPLESGEKSNKDKLHFALNHADRHIKWLSVTPEGKSAHTNQNPEFRPPSGYPTTYKRFWWDRPAPAITTCFSSISSQNNVHPRDTRAITIREAARLQTFPDKFQFMNSISSIRKQIGNAVPPKLAKVLADEIKKYILEN
jgi:DNA (cytosine-5)-methyltransferase 1